MPPPTSHSGASSTWPPSTIDALAVVPPMSKLIRSASQRRAPISAAPITPAAGPDSMQYIGLRAASSTGINPPLDCITLTGAAVPARRSSATSRSR